MLDTCPTFESFLYPLLNLSKNQEVRVRASADIIAQELQLSGEAMQEMTKNGNALRYVDRTYWSATYLRQAGLLKSSRRGWVVITEEGTKALQEFEGKITRQDLLKYKSFADFSGTKATIDNKPYEVLNAVELTPEEKISEALNEIEQTLVFEILERIHTAPPQFFENVVVKLLVSMGYGNANQAKVTGQSGDNGIDGVIDQDQLGLERVYLQEKRYETTNKVGSDSIRNFAGSLNLHQANKGLFFTTSSFTKSAIETADKVSQRIVLIDGERLAKLMIANGVGCSSKQQLNIMRIDEDFFDY